MNVNLKYSSNTYQFQVESLMMVGSYVEHITDEEMFCVYVSGLSSLAGVAIIVYVNFGVIIIKVVYIFNAT